MPSGDDQSDPTSNPFVRFKLFVDKAVTSGLDAMLGSSPPPAPDSRTPPTNPPSRFEPVPASDDLRSLTNITFSPVYSPAALRDIRQPVPKDLPAHLNGVGFTFEDAFEDLLTVSQGRQLPPIEHVYQRRQLLRQMFPQGEPEYFMRKRLHSSGLLPATTPELHKGEGPSRRGGLDELRRHLESKAEEVWGRAGPVTTSERLADDGSDMVIIPALRALIRMAGEDEIGRTFNEAKDTMDRKFKTAMSHEQEWSSQQRQQEERRQRELERPRDETPSFEELFSHVQASSDSGARSWQTFTQTISRSEDGPSGSRTVTRHVEPVVGEDGVRHYRVRTEEFDGEGKLVKSVTQLDPAGQGDSLAADGKADKKEGWFWK